MSQEAQDRYRDLKEASLKLLETIRTEVKAREHLIPADVRDHWLQQASDIEKLMAKDPDGEATLIDVMRLIPVVVMLREALGILLTVTEPLPATNPTKEGAQA